MNEENKRKFLKLQEIEGIEKTKELIESIEYLNNNLVDEKVLTYIEWIEGELNYFIDNHSDLVSLLKEGSSIIYKLNFILAVSSILNIILIILYFNK